MLNESSFETGGSSPRPNIVQVFYRTDKWAQYKTLIEESYIGQPGKVVDEEEDGQ